MDFYEQALSLSRAVGDRAGEATTLNNIGGVWSALGENQKALDFYEQALPLSRAVGDRAGEATTCFNIGVAYYQLNDLDRAIEYIERCVELDQELKHPDLESDLRTLNKLKAERDGGGRPTNDVIEAIGAFLQTSNWQQAKQVYREHEAVLSSPQVEQIFEMNIQRENDRLKQMYQNHLDRKSHGVEVAFEDAPQVPQSMEQMLGRLMSLLPPQLREALEQARSQAETQTEDEPSVVVPAEVISPAPAEPEVAINPQLIMAFLASDDEQTLIRLAQMIDEDDLQQLTHWVKTQTSDMDELQRRLAIFTQARQ